MEVRIVAEAPGSAAGLYGVLADLTTYPEWLELVHRVEPAEQADGDQGPAFWVDLRGRIGPLARSKRLRMVRHVHVPDQRVAFSRRELDGRRHSSWDLAAEVRPAGDGWEVRVDLRYDGRLWSESLESLLTAHVERAAPRLVALAESRSG
jgi:hypothetical protein